MVGANPMAALLDLLGWLGRQGSRLLVVALGIGLLVPALAEAARSAMPAAVMLVTFGAFLRIEPDRIRAELSHRGNLVVQGWVVFGVPLFAAAVVAVLEPAPDLGLAIILAALAPPVGSAAAIAMMLGLDVTLALVSAVSAGLVSPIVAPLLGAQLGGAAIALDPGSLALRLLLLVGGGAALAMLVRRVAGRRLPEVQGRATGVCVLGLIGLALGVVHGIAARSRRMPGRSRRCSPGAGLQHRAAADGPAAVLGAGLRRAMTIGLLSGNRNVTLIWAAALPVVDGRADGGALPGAQQRRDLPAAGAPPGGRAGAALLRAGRAALGRA
jgi:hypothetical protein